MVYGGCTSTLLPELKIRYILRGLAAAAAVDNLQKSRTMSIERALTVERQAIIGTCSTTDSMTNLSNPTGYAQYVLPQDHCCEKRYTNKDHLPYETLPCQSPQNQYSSPSIPLISPTTSNLPQRPSSSPFCNNIPPKLSQKCP